MTSTELVAESPDGDTTRRTTMTIAAKYAATCSACKSAIRPGDKIEWVRGQPVRHTSCASTGASSSAPPTTPSKTWDPDKFNGYGARRGGAARKCRTDGNCSSFGAGRSCGAPDCDGF